MSDWGPDEDKIAYEDFLIEEARKKKLEEEEEFLRCGKDHEDSLIKRAKRNKKALPPRMLEPRKNTKMDWWYGDIFDGYHSG